mmetsp:Transcript_79106/g.218909  ORF Transcript_79106/g.218909 Transcript_79106/m.218909 type:complete len:632 (+) Transcript_79106:107-2002(+)
MAGADPYTPRDQIWIDSMQVGLSETCLAERQRHRADTIYLIVMAGRIIAMQSGFAMMEAAFVRPMNAANIMMKNLMDMFIGCLAFYLFGYQIAFGDQAVSLDELGFDWAIWFLQFSYATTAATIDSGALAGRVSFTAYIILSMIMTGVIYPVVVKWGWGGGWLQELGYIDFAGGTIVHLVGAVSAFVCVCICGPRVGRFPEYRAWRGCWRWICAERNDDAYYRGPQTEVEKRVFNKVTPIHNPVQALFGVFLLLIGFLAFNPASTFATTDNTDLLAARTSVTTLLVTASAALTSFLVAALRRRSTVITIPEFATMTVAGMVASCGCCHVVPPLLMLPVGIIAALMADACQNFLNYLQLDDVVGAVAAHGPPGAFGVLCVPLLAAPHCQSELRGLFFGGGQEAWRLLGVQFAGVLAITGFTAVSTYLCVILLDLLLAFRSNRATELIGHDYMEHAYEDGSTSADVNKTMVIQHSPVRDCMRERISRLHSPTKSYGDEEDLDVIPCEPPVAVPSSAGLEANDSPEPEPDVDIVALQKEIRSLQEDVRLLGHMLHRTTVNNTVFGNHSFREGRRHSDPRAGCASYLAETRRGVIEEQTGASSNGNTGASGSADDGRCGPRLGPGHGGLLVARHD